MKKKCQTSFRISPEAKRLLARLARAMGITQTAVIETAIRSQAKKVGVAQ
jgi:predicted transcriptional regulator